MFRQIITPQNTQLLLQVPEEFVGQQVEIIAFPMKEAEEATQRIRKRTWDEYVTFCKKHAVDFSKIKKWKREDLYD